MASTDLVVVLPGIMGSTLGVKTADRLAGENLIWAPSAGAVWRLLTGYGPRIQDFPLPDGIGDAHPGDGVEPVGLMPDVHLIPGLWTPIRGYSRLVQFLEQLGYRPTSPGPESPQGNLLPVPYDWRLSNRYNGQGLAGIVEPALDRWRAQGGPYTDARLVFVCHSMGGLVARWYIEQCGGADLTRKLITLGTPWRGAGKALEQLVNGVRKGLGPPALDLTEFSRSLQSTYQLLPEYACIESAGDYLKTTETQVPGLANARLADAMAFHTALAAAEASRPASRDMTHMIVGTRQPTATTVRFQDDRAVALETFGPDNDYGDSTVPLSGAIGLAQPMDSPLVRRIADQHGNLQHNQGALDEIEEILTARPVKRRAARPVSLRIAVSDLVLPGEDLTVRVDIDGAERHGILIRLTSESGALLQSRQPRVTSGHAETRFSGLPPGAHSVTVSGIGPGSPVNPVTATTFVWTSEN